MNRRALALAGTAFALLLTASAASAKGHLQARPTLVELQPKAAAARLTLSNTGDEPVSAQVRVFVWTQQGGEDRLIATDQIVLSPPIVEVPAGGEQVVRIVRQSPAAKGSDQSYRLIVDELPGAKGKSGTVSLRMRYVLPLFVRSAEATSPDLGCRLSAAILTCDNKGGRAAQLGRTRLLDGKGNTVELSSGLFGYVLPGNQRQWTLDLDRLTSLSADLRLESQLNGQPVTLPVARAR